MDLSPYRFTIAMPGHALADLKRRLINTRWPHHLPSTTLKGILAYWQTEYRWHSVQAAMNHYLHYRVPVGHTHIHFLYQKGVGSTLPLILTHGQPGSFWDLQPLIGPLTNPAAHGGSAEQAFDVIIPSLPGQGFSDALAADLSKNGTPEIWHTLMTEVLGYTHYAAARCESGGHSTNAPTVSPSWAVSLNDSPAGLLAWLCDHLPPEQQTNTDQLITTTMLYWLTGTPPITTQPLARRESSDYHVDLKSLGTAVQNIRTAFYKRS
jgi:hypothetical protein